MYSHKSPGLCMYINYYEVPQVLQKTVNTQLCLELTTAACNHECNITRRKTFTHEKREQVGMDLVRSTEANRNHTSMHVIINSIILTPAILYTNIATICTSIYYTVHAYFFQTKL